jgi:hypothetical protein
LRGPIAVICRGSHDRWPRKGTIVIGADADLAISDPDRRVTLTNANLHHGVDYTPYEGLEVTGCPVTTIGRGAVIADARVIHGPTGHGTFLPRGACPSEAEPSGMRRVLSPTARSRPSARASGLSA